MSAFTLDAQIPAYLTDSIHAFIQRLGRVKKARKVGRFMVRVSPANLRCNCLFHLFSFEMEFTIQKYGSFFSHPITQLDEKVTHENKSDINVPAECKNNTHTQGLR